MENLIELLFQKTKIKKEYIANILKLLEDGSTIPFIARYRKELTGGVDDEVLREFESTYKSLEKLLSRKDEVIRLIQERAVLTPQLKKSIENAQTLQTLEDIYRPYKEKRTSRGTVAIQNGLLPLSKILRGAKLSEKEFKEKAKSFINKEFSSVESVVKATQDILAEQYSDLVLEREAIRNSMFRFGTLEIKKGKNFNENGLYSSFVSKSEKVAYVPSHRYLAVMRGVKEKELSVKIVLDVERVEKNIWNYKIPKDSSSSKHLLFEAYKDGLKRILLPSIEREVHKELKLNSDKVAIDTFGKNLKQLLMTPPVTKRVILGVDPAFVSGCKLAVIDENGNYLAHDVIYPTQPKNEYETSKRKVLALVKKYNITAVAIGNGTGSRETQEFFARINSEESVKLNYTIVSEAGASVYSASKIAKEEYPNLDVTIRGAISIAGRLRDPMATLVKIDPKSLGIGQYQHDVDQKLLTTRLDDVTQDIVNSVGVDINSASFSLLSHLSGIGVKIAHNIVEHREEIGKFNSKKQLLDVKGLGAKAYEQSAGFIRIKDSNDSLDNTGVHPESYKIAKELQKLDLDNINIDELRTKFMVGKETLKDIVKELKKPGFDPREDLPKIPFKDGISDIKTLKEGDFVSGVVRNITDFGVFVDIGLKNDGMIHISKMSTKRIKHPLEVLSLNQYLPKIEILTIDEQKGKVGLSLI